MKRVGTIVALTMIAAACLATPPKLSPEMARQVALQEQAAREWEAAEPPPEAYLRPEDQERARKRDLPCRPEDLDHGCQMVFYGQRSPADGLRRKGPCEVSLPNEPNTISFRDVDQCYRMTPPRHFHGVWLDEFEGSEFFPARETAPAKSKFDWDAPGARKKLEQQRRVRIWLDVDAPALADFERENSGHAVLIDFVGRETLYAGHYGHMGMSGHEIIVDHLINAKTLN